jgi:hypothetical protein
MVDYLVAQMAIDFPQLVLASNAKKRHSKNPLNMFILLAKPFK